MNIKPVQSRHTTSEAKQDPPPAESSQPEKGKGISGTSDSIEQEKGKNLEYLKAIGADLSLSDIELDQAAGDDEKGRSLLDLMATGQLFGASNEAMQKAKDKYLNDATPGGLEKVKFDLFADSQKIPAEKAKDAGLSLKALIDLKANLELLGEPDSGAVLTNPDIYDRIKKNGTDGVLADAAIKNLGLPDSAKGLPLKKILDGVAKAQKNGKDPTKNDYWDRVRKGHGDGSPNKTAGKGRPAHTPGDHDHPAAKPTDNRPRGKYIEEPIHHAKPGTGSHHRGDSAFNPLNRKKDEDTHTTTPPHQHHDSSKNTGARNTSQRNRNWQRETEPGTRQHRPKESSRPGGRSEGTRSGNTTQGSDSSNAPTQGTNPRGGAANDYSGTPGADHQTGVGVSSGSGKEAHSGAVVTLISGEHHEDGSSTYIWGRSGGDGLTDGMYVTTYTPNGDGTYHWVVTRFGTGEQVNEGTGNPPDDSFIGTSTQESDDDAGVTIFPTDDDDSTGAGGKPNPVADGSGDGLLHPWEISVHVGRTQQQIHTTQSSSGARPAVGRKKHNDGVTDPGEQVESHRVGGSKKFRRSEGYTDGAPDQGGGHKPVTPGAQPKQPSHAKTGDHHRAGHSSSRRIRRG